MTTTAFFAIIIIVFIFYLSPRVCTACDRRVSRQRFANPVAVHSVKSNYNNDQGSGASLSAHDFCEALASLVLSGVSSRDALMRAMTENRIPDVVHEICQRRLSSPEPFGSVILGVKHDLAHTDHRDLGALLALCVNDGVFVSDALKQAAELLRSEVSLQQSIDTATAHARITMQVLSLLPVIFLVLGTCVSHSFASVVFSAPGTMFLFIAASLNVVGRQWAKRLISRVGRSGNERDAHLTVMGICVSIYSGQSLVGACLSLRNVSECGARIAARLEANETLESALTELVHHFSEHGDALRKLILDCASNGLPLREAAHHMADSIRRERMTAVASRSQQLSTTLSLPIVFCMLPSFGIAVLMPLLIASMSSLVRAA